MSVQMVIRHPRPLKKGKVMGREGQSGGRFCKHWNLIAVLGPTASGKTALAVRLARKIGGEIISADSRQVYRGMDLGTGKDLSEYGCNGDAVPFHLIDICDPTEEFSVFAFQQRFIDCFRDIAARGKIPFLVGGTGLYLDSVLRGYRMAPVPLNASLRERLTGYDMESLRRYFLSIQRVAHNSTDLLERERLIRAIEIAEFSRDHPTAALQSIQIEPLVIGICLEREELRRKITLRLQTRLQAGMIDEVKRLHDRGVNWERFESFGLEYRYISRYLQHKISHEEMFQILNTRIRQFAKRQETWFRGMGKKGVPIHWMDGPDEEAAFRLIMDPE